MYVCFIQSIIIKVTESTWYTIIIPYRRTIFKYKFPLFCKFQAQFLYNFKFNIYK